jgi:hypothetical protein
MRFRIVFVATAVAVLAALAVPAHATHRWGKYHWKGTGERTIPLVDSTVSPWGSHVSAAVSDWNVSPWIQLNKSTAAADRSTCPAIGGKVRVCNYTYGDNGWLGIAQIWISRGGSGHIAQGIVELNDTYFNQAPYNTAAYRQFVTCQEIGHTFGLDHQDENQTNTNLGSCMDYTRDPDGSINNQLSNEYPNAHDFEELAIIYTHDDSAKKGGPPFGGASNGSSRSVQVRQDGAYTLVTFILWAD